MPLPTLVSLITTVASHAVNLAGKVVDSAEAKGATPKSVTKGKPSSEKEKQANTFAACLAAAAAPPATPVAVPTVATSTSAQKAPVKSQNESVHSVLSASAPPTPAKLSPPATKIASAPATSAKVSSPVAPASQSGLEGMAAIRQKRFRSFVKTPAVPVAATNASIKPLSREGKNEAHLGIHAPMEAPTTEASATGLLSPKQNDLPTAPPPEALKAISPAPESETKASSTTPPVPHSPPASSLIPETAVSIDKGTANDKGTNTATTQAILPSWLATPSIGVTHNRLTAEHTNHTDSHPISPMSVPMESRGMNIVSPVQTTPPSHTSSDRPVVDQLTRAVAAHVEVVQREGQTNVHLHLDPPQLGSVQIHLTATGHSVSARIVVAQEGTRQLLQDQAQNLRQSLAQAGVSLGSFDVARDGGGGSRGGNDPQTMPQPPRFASTPTISSRPAAVPSVSRATEGIDLIA
jgi:flagellar hook-length control protein FliK